MHINRSILVLLIICFFTKASYSQFNISFNNCSVYEGIFNEKRPLSDSLLIEFSEDGFLLWYFNKSNSGSGKITKAYHTKQLFFDLLINEYRFDLATMFGASSVKIVSTRDYKSKEIKNTTIEIFSFHSVKKVDIKILDCKSNVDFDTTLNFLHYRYK